MSGLDRRAFIGVLAAGAAGCAVTEKLPQGIPRAAQTRDSTKDGERLLAEAAEAHGRFAFAQLNDINVAYDGEWFERVASLQRVLVDRDFRKSSEERYLPRAKIAAQTHRGPGGVKQVARLPGTIQVWYNGALNRDRERNDAAQLVVDAYQLFLLGPLFLQDRNTVVETAGVALIDNQPHDLLLATITPGFGVAAIDRVLAYVSRRDRTFARVRISLGGLRSTRSAAVEVDMADYVDRLGVRFPTRFFERVTFPVRLDAHRWQVTGLDVNRGYGATDIQGETFTWLAAAPAKAL